MSSLAKFRKQFNIVAVNKILFKNLSFDKKRDFHLHLETNRVLSSLGDVPLVLFRFDV